MYLNKSMLVTKKSRWGRDFPPVQTGPGAHPASCTMGTGSFPGVKCGPGMLLTTHSLLVPRSWKSRAIPLPTLWGHTGPVTGSLYFYYLLLGSFPGVKCGRGVLLNTHPLLVPRSWKSRAVPLPTLWGHTGPVTGSLYFSYFYGCNYNNS
jgi:hypothetical protein